MGSMQLPGDKPAAPARHAPLAATVVTTDVRSVATDALVVNLFQGVTTPTGATGAVDAALGGAISRVIAAGDLSGKLGETAVLYPQGEIQAKRVIVVGLGPESSFSVEAARRASASALLTAKRLGAADVATIAHGAGSGSSEGGGGGGLGSEAAAQATLEGALLATYAFAGWRGGKDERRIESLTLVGNEPADTAAFEAAAAVANALNAGASLARDLVNLPPNVATPRFIAEQALALTRSTSLKVDVGDLAWAEERKMGAFVSVARGSANPPAFIRIEHNAGRDDLPTIVLVGKGVSFDSGGLSLKTRDGMVTMKCDMGGAAAVIGALLAASRLDLPLHIVGLCPCVENMPDGAAFRPGDVVVASNGVSIEIISTDAEGRLALADALVHAGEYRPQAVVDIATLTGASVTALGAGVAASLFSTDEALSAALVASGRESGEKVWPMPLFDEYRQTIKSKVVADLRNTGGAQGGVGTAAVFLQAFTDYPWAHVDMAGMALDDSGSKERPYQVPGATGYGVRLLVSYLRNAARRGAA